jgi:hypothetical protein
MELSFGEIRMTAKIYLTCKKIIGIMANVKQRISYTEVFKKFNIPSLAGEFLLSLLLFTVDNLEKFQTNSDIHSINTRHKHDLHMLNANLISYQKGLCYAGIKLFNTLPSSIESLSHDTE